MADIVTDLSIPKNWNVAVGKHNTFTFTFTSFNITGYVFSLQIQKFNEPSTNIVNLTEGAGLTNGGASTVLTAVLTAAQSALLTHGDYFWQLSVVHPDTFTYRWFNGTLRAKKQLYTGDTVSNVTATITINGTAVTVTMTIAGSVTLAQLATTLQTAAADTTPLDADTFNFYDAVDAVLKKITWANIKATLKTYFDTIYCALTNTPTTITDGATITLTTAEHTLSTAQAAISVTDNYTGDYCGVRLTLSGITACTLTFVTGTAFGVFNGTASGDNTMAITGVAGDVVEISRKKLGTVYTYVGLNRGQ